MTRKTIMLSIVLFLCWGSGLAAGSQYEIRVDGLACPFCAYGIEKKFVKTAGVDAVDIDIVRGLVIVNTHADKSFSESELKQLINDAGFTMRGFTIK